MTPIRRCIPATLLVIALVAHPLSALGPGVIGCSILPDGWGSAVQQGLDDIFLGACTAHDFCYRTCNPPDGPYVGYGWKVGCDTTFGVDLAFACETWSLILSFPNVEWVDRDEFLDECLDYAAYGYGLVLSVGTFFFLDGQCNEYCNQWACPEIGIMYGDFQHFNCLANCWGGVDPRDPNDCEQAPWGYDCPPCPIALDLQGNGLKLTGPNPPVHFDLDADGTPDHTSWTRLQTKDAFLVLDRNGNGTIDNGRELFGTATLPLLTAEPPRHGYEALAEFDRFAAGGNEDGVIDATDAIFEHLQLWLDTNRDAVTQEGELHSLGDFGVSGISLLFTRHDQEDQWGNVFRWWSPIYFEDGSTSMSVDVFFRRQSE